MNFEEYCVHGLKVSAEKLRRFGLIEDESNEKKRLLYQHIISIQLLKEMKNITGILNENAIPHVFLKGPLLAELLYRPCGLRVDKRKTSDIDILIPIRSMPAAFDVLGKYGYEFKGKRIDSSTCVNYIKSNQNGVFHSVHFPDVTRNGIAVDLHVTGHLTTHGISECELQNIAELQCQRKATITVNNVSYPYLCNKDLLLSLCSHFAKHILTALRYISCETQNESYPMPLFRLSDVELLLDRNIDWFRQSIMQIVTASREQHCFFALLFCIRLLNNTTGKYAEENAFLANTEKDIPTENTDDDILLYCAGHYSIESYINRPVNDLMKEIRSNVKPRNSYICSYEEETACSVTVKSDIDPTVFFKWKMYVENDGYCIEWKFSNERLRYPETGGQPWQIKGIVEENQDLILGVVFSGGHCECKQKYCAKHYALRVSDTADADMCLYRVRGISDPYEMADKSNYRLEKRTAGEETIVRLTLYKSLFSPESQAENRYFDIYGIFPGSGNNPACYLSWNKEKNFHSINCMYCGKLSLNEQKSSVKSVL